MNTKSLLFVFALFALFSSSMARVIDEKKVSDDELLNDAISLMQKILLSKEEVEKEKIAASLKTSDDDLIDIDDDDVEDDDEPVDQEPPVDLEPPVNKDEKYLVDITEDNVDIDEAEGLGPVNDEDVDVEVITVTVEIEENADGEIIEQPQVNVDLGKNVVVADFEDNVDAEAEEVDVEEDGAVDEEVDVGEIDDNGVEEIVQNPDALGNVEYEIDITEVDTPKEETNHFNVEEAEYNDENGTYETVVSVEGNEDSNSSGILGASVAVVGAFGVIAGLGYKYTQRKKRVLLPFHEDLLEKDGFYDNAEQHIIPVWAATCKKEENEEEKEDEDKLFEVVYNYEPELPDELKLTVGDKIKIKEIYEDGWAYGYNKTTQLFGTFPSTSLGEDFNPESVPQYKPEEVPVEMNDNMVEELKKKIVESN